MDLVLSVKGDDKTASHLERIGDKPTHAHGVLKDLAQQIADIQQGRFDTNQGMKAEAKSTKATDKRQNRDPRPLRATGALMRSVTHMNDRNQRLEIGNDFLVFGTKVSYARFHQLGKGVPKRKVINLTPRQRSQLAETILKWLTEDERA